MNDKGQGDSRGEPIASEGVLDGEALLRERYELLGQVEDWLELPMQVLALVWLALLVGELIWGENLVFGILGYVIWAIFILDFALEFVLAPHKGAYLKRNWLIALSLVVPAVRLLRVFRAFRLLRLARTARGVRLFRVVTSLNRSMRAMSANLRRRGFGYVAGITVLVVLAGAAGMYAFESDNSGGLNSYGDALWWTAMVMTTIGSGYWPVSSEGRILSVLLSLYALGVAGYVTATLATYFVGRDAESQAGELAGSSELAALRKEMAAFRGT
ncbi:MAG: ion transporter, partial [Anaerolineae bacterium]